MRHHHAHHAAVILFVFINPLLVINFHLALTLFDYLVETPIVYRGSNRDGMSRI